MKNNYHIEYKEFNELVGSGSSRIAATIATAGTTLVIGYALGWRGGLWYANRKFRKEQMKLLGQIKPKRWQVRFFRRPLIRPKLRETVVKSSDALKKNASVAHNSEESVTGATKL